MQLNARVVKGLLGNRSQNQLAKEIGISRGSFSNALAGRRGAGRKLLAGLIRAFPDQTITSLTIS
jgi:hypothetical protein